MSSYLVLDIAIQYVQWLAVRNLTREAVERRLPRQRLTSSRIQTRLAAVYYTNSDLCKVHLVQQINCTGVTFLYGFIKFILSTIFRDIYE